MTQSDTDFPDAPHRGQLLDARLHLLDRQLLNHDGDPVGIVDDLELDGVTPGADSPRLTGVLSGHVLGTRIFGGQPPTSRLQTIPWRLVARVGTTIHLGPTEMSFDALWVEHWLRDHVIAHIPGGRRATK
jgi:hypothetical protein